MASWACSNCTFINNNNSTPSSCEICLTPKPQQTAPSSSKPKWSCKSCTFLNSYINKNCDICGTRASASLSSTYELNDQEFDSTQVGSVFLPLRACKRKNRETPVENLDNYDDDLGFRGAKLANKALGVLGSDGFRGAKSEDKTVAGLDETNPSKDSKTLKVLSYNVWFREDLEMHRRMEALGDLIQQHSPDLICFQEVTPNIYDIFQQSSWWKLYKCSVSNEMALTRPYFCMQLSKLAVKSFSCKPFRNSIMGRELCVAEVTFEADKPLVIATSHLESPCPGPPKWDQMYSKERVAQANEALNFLKTNANVIFCGDMNWDDKLDGQVPLPDGWIDAWTELRPRELGYTYDTKSNMMLSGNRSLQKRLDRFLCCLRDFKVEGIEMIGTEAIPGLSYCKEKKARKEVKNLVLPVLPSDHYGLLLTICSLQS